MTSAEGTPTDNEPGDDAGGRLRIVVADDDALIREGIAAAFAGVSGGFSANLLPGQLDALLFGITEASVETVFGDFTANIAGNWYFIAAMLVVFMPVIWWVTDRIIEPRLGPWSPALAGNAVSPEQHGEVASGDRELTGGESK